MNDQNEPEHSSELDSSETTEANPKSWIAWKRRAEKLEIALKIIKNSTDNARTVNANRRDRINQLATAALKL